MGSMEEEQVRVKDKQLNLGHPEESLLGVYMGKLPQTSPAG